MKDKSYYLRPQAPDLTLSPRSANARRLLATRKSQAGGCSRYLDKTKKDRITDKAQTWARTGPSPSRVRTNALATMAEYD